MNTTKAKIIRHNILKTVFPFFGLILSFLNNFELKGAFLKVPLVQLSYKRDDSRQECLICLKCDKRSGSQTLSVQTLEKRVPKAHMLLIFHSPWRFTKQASSHIVTFTLHGLIFNVPQILQGYQYDRVFKWVLWIERY